MTQLIPHSVSPGEKIKLSDIPSGPTSGHWKKKKALKQMAANAVEMAELAKRLYAEDTRSILLVLQGMDTAGKDGTIRNVMRGMNPTSCQVSSFKRPSEEELDHDFLWRVHKLSHGVGTSASSTGVITKMCWSFEFITSCRKKFGVNATNRSTSSKSYCTRLARKSSSASCTSARTLSEHGYKNESICPKSTGSSIRATWKSVRNGKITKTLTPLP